MPLQSSTKNRSLPVPEEPLRILLDQNVPKPVAVWLRNRCADWEIHHVNELGFEGKPDTFLQCWAQGKEAIIVTYDEDFADSRFYPLGEHHGIIRLRVWPTTIEKTQEAMERLLHDLPHSKWKKSLIIILLSAHNKRHFFRVYFHCEADFQYLSSSIFSRLNISF